MPSIISVDLDEISNAIQESIWFKDMPDDVVRLLTDHAQVKRYDKGEEIYNEGQIRQHLFGMLNGCLNFSLIGDGQQVFSIMDFHNTFWFGESALLESQSTVARITATGISDVISIPAFEVKHIADQYPLIYRNMYFDKMRQLQLSYDMFTSVLTFPLTARLSLRLLSLLDERGFATSKGQCLSPAPTVDEWAKISMGSKQRVKIILEEWINFGCIIKEHDTYFIPDPVFFETEAVN